MTSPNAPPWFSRGGCTDFPFFYDFSPAADFPGGALALLLCVYFCTLEMAMQIHAAQPLFAWGSLEDCPTLVTIRDFLASVPDQHLLAGLRAARGHGRDDYPVERLWRVVLMTSALRHTCFNACLAELHRNPALCQILEIASEKEIPNGWNISRFLRCIPRAVVLLPYPVVVRQS